MSPAQPSFKSWLLTQVGRDDSVGALAHHAQHDPGMPEGGSYYDYRNHLEAVNASPAARLALSIAWLYYSYPNHDPHY